MQKYKAIIIGTSLTGKTTTITHLRKTTKLPLREIDEELTKANGGTFPHDHIYKDIVLVPAVKTQILASDNIIFFTNAQYFTIEDLQKARQKGLKIIQFFADKEVLLQRNKQRMRDEGYEDHSRWLDAMFAYQKEIKDKGLVDAVIETNKPVEDVAKELITVLNKH